MTYTSSNKKVATVTSKGKVKAVNKGKCKITVKAGKKKAYVTITVC
ncbi:MAG: Ig-like domain-containing protein [Blautia faecis]